MNHSSVVVPLRKLAVSTLLAATLLLGIAANAQTAAQSASPGGVASSWQSVAIPPLPEWKPAQPKRVELPNGMIVFLQEDHELPLIQLSAIVRGGARSEPADKTGLVEIFGDVWRTGGTTKLTGDQMDDFLEARAAKLETDGSGESSTISLDCLKDDFGAVFPLFIDLLRTPAFREEKIQLAQNELNTNIARRNDNSPEIADREAGKLAYGKNNPYARDPEYATVAAVTRADLVNWYRQHVAPNNMIVGVVGDFDSAQMEQTLRQAFGGWERGPQVSKPEIPLQPAKPGVYVVDKPDVNQSEIRFVSLGIERRNPDWFAVQVMNQIMSGGFASRLMADLRTKRGLAYSVGGRLGADWDHPGIFYLTIGTKSATTVDAIEGMRRNMAELRSDPPSESELKFAKDSLLNSFIFRFDTPAKVLRERMACEFYGYPLNFLEMSREAIGKVTTADVQRVIEKYVHPEQFAVLVVGNSTVFEKPLAALGPATKLDITIPGTAATPATAARPARSTPAGKQLIAKVVQFLGGEARLKAVQSLRQRLRVEAGGSQVQVEQTLVYPGTLVSTVRENGRQMRMVVTPTGGFQEMAGKGSRDLPPSFSQQIARELRYDVVDIARHANDPKYIFTGGQRAKAGDREAVTLDIYFGDQHERWLVNPSTGEILRASYQTMTEEGPAQKVIDYANWKPVSGIMLPFASTSTRNGQDAEKETTESWTVNPKLDPAALRKSAAR